MSHSVSKARIRTSVSPDCTRPKCKVEAYGLGRKQSLMNIANRLHFQAYNVAREVSTTWVTTDAEIIGVETRHMQELGMDIANFFNPVFKESASLEKVKAEQVTLETGIERGSVEKENSTLKAPGMNAILSNPIGRRCSNVSISDKVMTLMASGNVQQINFSEIKCKLKAKRASAVSNNRVVKLHKEISTSFQKIKKIDSQSALRASNRPKPKLTATVIERKIKDTLINRRHGQIKAPLSESTFITNINDPPDKSPEVCEREESPVKRCPPKKSNLKTTSKTVIAKAIIRREEKASITKAPVTYGRKRPITLQDRYKSQIYPSNSMAVIFNDSIHKPRKKLTSPRASGARVPHHEDNTLEEPEILPAPRVEKRSEFNLLNRKKLSSWQVLGIIALIFISISLFVWAWSNGKYRELFLYYW